MQKKWAIIHPYEDLVKSGYKQILCMNLYNQASKFMATHF
jgi:hypothetical protein